MKTYLVTGGAGFIGSNFIHYMLSRYDAIHIINLDKLTYAGNLKNLAGADTHPNYTFIQTDICDETAVTKVFAQYDIDYVVNFAAESHVDRSIADPQLFVKTNVLGTANLLEQAKTAWQLSGTKYKDGCKFLQISTDEVYGSLGKSGFFTETSPLDPHSPYSASKAAADLLVKSYADTYGLPINITRSSNNYGPRQFPEKLIPLFIRNALQHKELPVYGDGMQVRDWLYVEDNCRAIDLVLQSGAAGEIYNIGANNEQPNLTIAKMILAHIKAKADAQAGEYLIKHVEDRLGHDRRYGIDSTKIKTHLGWQPQAEFITSLANTIDWYLNNKNFIGI